MVDRNRPNGCVFFFFLCVVYRWCTIKFRRIVKAEISKENFSWPEHDKHEIMFADLIIALPLEDCDDALGWRVSQQSLLEMFIY